MTAPISASRTYQTKRGRLTSENTAMAAGMLVMAPANMKLSAAGVDMPDSMRPATTGTAANPFKYAGTPITADNGMASAEPDPNHCPSSSGGTYLIIKLSSKNANVSHLPRKKIIEYVFCLNS